MLDQNKILDEKVKSLREKSIDVGFPFKKEYKKLIKNIVEHLTKSQDEEYAEKHGLRPGMGLAAVQLGINERFFVIVSEQENGKYKEFVIINPKIISYSEELVYAGVGEGCLSVNREIEGIIPRYARVTVESYDMDGKKIKTRVREEEAIAFQHEIDHLEGILFVDRIDKDNPYKNSETMRMI